MLPFNHLPISVINFLSIVMFTWVTFLMMNFDEKQKDMMPLVYKYRRSFFLVQSVLVSIITTLIPVGVLLYGIPLMLIISIMSLIYRKVTYTRLRNYREALQQGVTSTMKTGIKLPEINHFRAQYTMICTLSNVTFASFWIMSFIVIFSIMHRL